MFIVREGAKTSQGGAFFGGGQSILIKTWGVEMNFSHFGGRGDNILSLGLGVTNFVKAIF